MSSQPHDHPVGGHRAGGRGGHGWMMIACCIPMIVIAVTLVVTGAVSADFLFVAIACTAMMALMMRGMSHGAASSEDADRSTHADHSR